MGVMEYAEAFIHLSKYAQHIILTEAQRVRQFRMRLIPPLYNVLAATEFPTLSKLIDKAKELENRNKEVRIERE